MILSETGAHFSESCFKGRVQSERASLRSLFSTSLSLSLNGQAARPQLDVHAFGLMAVLIELIAEYGDGDRKRADHKIKHVGAGHGGFPFDAIAPC
jgi:hypothetical protein